MPVLDKFREECGVVAIYGHPEASTLAYLGLHALQHRGQESAGIAASDSIEAAASGRAGVRSATRNGVLFSQLAANSGSRPADFSP